MSETILEVKKKHESFLLSLPGVVSVGIGQDLDGKPLIVVGLDKPRPKTEKKLPQKLDDFPVQVKVVGPVKAL
jgi:hypothetical protein